MRSFPDAAVTIQSCSRSVPSVPGWFGEATFMARHVSRQGMLERINEQVHFARRRVGRYEVIDFLAVLFGYAVSGERTMEAFYAALQPIAEPFMALFGRKRLPSRSTLSRFLAALSSAPVEALRTLFLSDLLARPLSNDQQIGELRDRCGVKWLVFDIDGTREAARQRALPQGRHLPESQRRLQHICAPGYPGRKRGEVIRTRTVVSQAHSYQWLGSFGNPGNGRYREELRRAVEAIRHYLEAHHIPSERALLRLDGQYGTGAVLSSLARYRFVTRGKVYAVLDQPQVQTRLHLSADQTFSCPESRLVRQLYDCASVLVGPQGERFRVVVATHPAGQTKCRVGLTRNGIVYELFLTNLPQDAFTAADVVALYLHRGAFENSLADEDIELDPDRWCSHAACGQEAWQIVAQWVWNLRLELGHRLAPTPLRITEFASAVSEPTTQQGYELPVVGGAWKAGRFSGQDFTLQPDGMVRCPADKVLFPCERRREQGGSLRIVFAARIADCRACPKREQCQWHGHQTTKPRQMSILLHPLKVGPAPLLWRDWPRREHRRACMQLVRRQRLDVTLPPPPPAEAPSPSGPLSRAQRAHSRLPWHLRRFFRVRPALHPSNLLLPTPARHAFRSSSSGASSAVTSLRKSWAKKPEAAPKQSEATGQPAPTKDPPQWDMSGWGADYGMPQPLTIQR